MKRGLGCRVRENAPGDSLTAGPAKRERWFPESPPLDHVASLRLSSGLWVDPPPPAVSWIRPWPRQRRLSLRCTEGGFGEELRSEASDTLHRVLCFACSFKNAAVLVTLNFQTVAAKEGRPQTLNYYSFNVC